jgi:hypothetical protein
MGTSSVAQQVAQWPSLLAQAINGKPMLFVAESFCPVAFSQYASNMSSWAVLNHLLDLVLQITESEYGFIGHRAVDSSGVEFLSIQALTNIAWHPSLEKVKLRMR